MAKLIQAATIIAAAGSPPKQIEEFVGRVNTGTEAVSIARMRSPRGWQEPGQICGFDEYSIVLRGTLHLALRDGQMDVHAGQAVFVPAGQWVRYSTPGPEGAEYMSICLPAFSPETAKRDE